MTLGIFIYTEKVGAHTVTVSPDVYFHLWQQNTYVDFASNLSFDSIKLTEDRLYLNQYWFSVRDANLTISEFFTEYQLVLFVHAPSETLSTMEIYVDDWGEPTSVYSTNGTLTWSYNVSNKSMSFTITHHGRVEVIVDWALIGDVNRDGVVNEFDLEAVSRAFGSDPAKPTWNMNCDFNRDSIVDSSDLFGLGKNYGSIKTQQGSLYGRFLRVALYVSRRGLGRIP